MLTKKVFKFLYPNVIKIIKILKYNFIKNNCKELILKKSTKIVKLPTNAPKTILKIFTFRFNNI